MRKTRLVIFSVPALLAAALTWANWPGPTPLPAGTVADRVVVRKSARVLEVMRAGSVLRTYRVSLGSHPVGPKQREGDGRTPEASTTFDYRNPSSAFHFALHVSYPSTDDRRAAAAQGVSPGGLIMVHGLRNGIGFIGRLHRLADWTNGCIALTNPEIDELARVVPDGTPILIQP